MIINVSRDEAQAISVALRFWLSQNPKDLPNVDQAAAAITAGDAIDARLSDPDPEEVFVLWARDLLAVAAINAYRAACAHAGLDDQRFEVSKALVALVSWQQRHPNRLRMPDHRHQPAKV